MNSMTVYIVRSETIDQHGDIVPCIACTADDQVPIKLTPFETLDCTWEFEDLGISITCFKKGDPPKQVWSGWTERIRRWISFNPAKKEVANA